MTVRVFIQKVVGKLRFWADNAKEILFGYAILLVQVFLCKRRYKRIVERIKWRPKGQKIRVLFMSDNISKWKCQSVYMAMAESSLFEPIIAVTMKPRELRLTCEDRKRMMSERTAFFEKIGNRVMSVCDPVKGTFLDLKQFHPDIVFFEEPWLLPDLQNVFNVSGFALSCYVPYSYEMGFDPKLTCMRKFHRLMWRLFVNNKERVGLYERFNKNCEMSGKAVFFGYPQFDFFNNQEGKENSRQLVIYAPHFSFKVPGQEALLRLGTFEWNGREMLEYAKAHKEINWMFKPHPGLYNRLIDSGFMTAVEAKRYYDEWSCIGTVCYDGEYLRHFMSAKALITDCASFLVEFLPTGMPIIRMVPENVNWKPTPLHEKLFSTYYTAHNWNELKEFMETVLFCGADPQKEIRIAVAQELGVLGNNAAKGIVKYLASNIN